MAGFQRDIGEINPVLVQPEVDTYVKPIDTSKAELITTFGNAATSVYNTYQTNKLRGESTEVIEDFLSSNGVNSAGETNLDNDPTVVEARQRAGKLSTAVSSGAMTEGQMRIRLQAMMRGYINRAPGLADNFRKVSAQTLGGYDAVIDSVAADQRARAKQSAAMQKAYLKRAAELHIPPSTPWPELVEEVNRRERVKADAAIVEENNAQVEATYEAQQKKIARGMPALIAKKYEDLNDGFQTTIDSDLPLDKKLQSIEIDYQQAVAGLSQANQGALDSGDLERRTTLLKSARDIAKRVASGATTAEAAKSDTANIKAVSENKLINQPGAAEFQAFVSMSGVRLDSKYFTNHPQLMASYFSLMNGALVNLNDSAPVDTEGKKEYAEGVNHVLTATVDEYKKNKGENGSISADVVINMVGGLTLNTTPGKTTNIETYNTVLKTTSREGFKDAVNDPNKSIEAQTAIDNTKRFLHSYAETRWLPSLANDIAKMQSSTLQVGGFHDEDAKRAGDYIATVVSEETGGLTFVVDRDKVDAANLSLREQQYLRIETGKLQRKFSEKWMYLVQGTAHINGSDKYADVGQALYGEMKGKIPVRPLFTEDEEE